MIAQLIAEEVHGTPWTDRDFSTLRKHWPDIKRISAETGRTPTTIQRVANTNKIYKVRHWTYEEQILVMQTKNSKEAALLLKRTQSSVMTMRTNLRSNPDFMWMLKAHKACQTLQRKAMNWAIENRIQGRMIT